MEVLSVDLVEHGCWKETWMYYYLYK